jgi:hypothetical protein
MTLSLSTVLIGTVAAYVALWLFQGVMLHLNGERFLAGYLRFPRDKPALRWTGRVVQQASLIVLIVAAPLAARLDPVVTFERAYPLPVPWRDIGITAAVIIGIGIAGCFIALWTGLIRYQPHYDRRTRWRKIMRRCLYPVPLAMVEEAVFRSFVLGGLLAAVPETALWQTGAVTISAAVFSAAHFVRPKKPFLQPAFGLFVVGCVFGLAYILGRRTLWLAVTAHACAIFVNEQARLQVVYQGPTWMIGPAEFGYSGLFGAPFVVAMGVVLWLVI